jgi:hypothetical protein
MLSVHLQLRGRIAVRTTLFGQTHEVFECDGKLDVTHTRVSAVLLVQNPRHRFAVWPASWMTFATTTG